MGVPSTAGHSPALIAGRDEGLAIYEATGTKAELVLLDALEPHRGIGTALVECTRRAAGAGLGIRELWLTTTNDNLDPLRFYLRRGFRLMEVRPRMSTVPPKEARIPEIGDYDIPMRDELRLVREIADCLRLGSGDRALPTVVGIASGRIVS